MKKVFNCIVQYTGKRLIFFSIVMIFAVSIFEQISVLFVAKTINSVLEGKIAATVIALAVAFMVLTPIAKSLLNRVFDTCKIQFTGNLKKEMIRSILSMNIADFEKHSFSDINARNSEDIGGMDYEYNYIYKNIPVCLIKMSIAFYVVSKISIFIAIIAVIIPVAYNLIFISQSNYVKRMQGIEWKRRVFSNNFFEEALASWTEIKGIGSENYIQKKYQDTLDKHYAAQLLIAKFWGRVSAGDSFLTQAFPLIIIFIMSMLSSSAGTYNMGNIYVILYNLPILLSFVWDFDINAINRFAFSMNKVEEITGQKDDDAFALSPDKKDKIQSIVFSNVGYSYEKKTIFSNVSMDIQAGEKVLIKGKSGSGKTSIIKLLLKTASGYRGSIKINDTQLSEIPAEEIYRHVFYCKENPYFFSGTFYRNLRFVKGFEAGKVEQLLSLFPRIKTKLLANDINARFSSGEKRILSFMESMLSDKEVLIYDEIFANVDPENQQKKKFCTLFNS